MHRRWARRLKQIWGFVCRADKRCKLSNTSHFSNDLGLDSLDTVEVVMAIEEVGLTG